ncbi:LOW QUALITY PROTEIN: hypothetical protein U9M48_037142 [Paspalum notatum var. saurae]|uniref:DUF6598 domain-containing protein n=1 Tax=Paspalum notatum var. saurae TaxID=547442 RepID=A0AAQ3UJ18_PASNO
MEAEGGGLGATLAPDRGKKRPPSSPTLTDDDDDEWLLSSSEEDEDHEDNDDKGTYLPFTMISHGPVVIFMSRATLCLEMKKPNFEGLHQSGFFLHSNLESIHLIQIIILLINLKGVARLSLISPARVISMISRALIEFELHDRNEDETGGDDSLIIEGIAELDNITFKPKPYVEHQRVYGERCALDIKYMAMINAVEARIELTVLRLGVIPGGVNMKLYAKNSSFGEVIRLFQGVPPKPGNMMSFAVAVERHNSLDLYIESHPRGNRPTPGKKLRPYQCWQCGFASGYHGMSEKVAELGEFAAFSVKVTWSSYNKRSS